MQAFAVSNVTCLIVTLGFISNICVTPLVISPLFKMLKIKNYKKHVCTVASLLFKFKGSHRAEIILKFEFRAEVQRL